MSLKYTLRVGATLNSQDTNQLWSACTLWARSFIVRRALKRQKHATDTAPLHAFPPLLVTKPPPPPPPPPPATSTEEDETAADPYNDNDGQHGQNEAVDQTTREGDLTTVDNVRLPHLTVDRAGATTSTGFSHRPPAAENTGGPKRSATHAVLVNHRSRGPARGPSLLPNIHRGSGGSGPAAVSVSVSGGAGKVVLSLETDHHGMTRMMHTFHHSHGRAGKRGGKKGGGERGSGGVGVRVAMVEDERYRRLERVLVKVQPPNDGYLELSPSFHLPRQGVTFTRPSSFVSRSSSSSPRRRRPSSSSSLAPGPVVVGLLWCHWLVIAVTSGAWWGGWVGGGGERWCRPSPFGVTSRTSYDVIIVFMLSSTSVLLISPWAFHVATCIVLVTSKKKKREKTFLVMTSSVLVWHHREQLVQHGRFNP